MLVLLMGVVMSASIANFFSLSRTVDMVSEENIRSVVAAQAMIEALERQEDALYFVNIGHFDEGSHSFNEAWQHHTAAVERALEIAEFPPNRRLVTLIAEQTDI